MSDPPVPRPLPGQVGPAARTLGFAGLLPQLAAAWLTMVAPSGPGLVGLGPLLAFGYGGLILSFLGGMWWGFAMRRPPGAQGRLALVAVLPSLATLAIGIAGFWLGGRWALVLLGVAIILTLGVDLRLFRAGEAPAGWMALRVPLSLGLGALTMAVALFTQPAVTQY